jgi:putative ABC transport system ATP-binding protein
MSKHSAAEADLGIRLTEADEQTLHAQDVVVRYGQLTAVAGVTLTARPRRLIAVTGPSGAGKSSLLNALAGLVPVASGQIRLGESVVRGGHQDPARIVIIPQGNALAAVLTAVENVALPLLARPDRVEDARTDAMAALESLGVDEAAGQLVDELSGGQQQRVAVARGLAQRGAVLLADEPTSELDAGNRGIVMRLLRQEADRGAAVIMATHDQETAELCDAELHLDEGVPTWVRGTG